MTNTVNRYECSLEHHPWGPEAEMIRDDNGAWVRWEDYEHAYGLLVDAENRDACRVREIARLESLLREKQP